MSIFDSQQTNDYEKNKTFGQDVHFNRIAAGAGASKFEVNKDGLFLGADNFADAPFSVDMDGNLKSTSGTFSGTLSGATGSFSGDISGASGTFAGAITTDEITDSTYGFSGVFVKQIKTTSFSNENLLIGPDNGGLLNVSANYKSAGTGYFWWLTPVAHFYVFKSGGNYYIYHAGVQIDADTNADTVYYTCLFSSNESANGY